MPASMTSSATWISCLAELKCGGLRECADAEGACRPKAASGHRPPRRAPGYLDHESPGRPARFRSRAEALRAAYAPRAGQVVQRSKLSWIAVCKAAASERGHHRRAPA